MDTDAVAVDALDRSAGPGPSERPPLHRKPLGSQIAQRLRDDILLGRLPPGTPVSQQGLSDTYRTSRIPARDAIRQLVHEGFLVNTPGGQTVVSRLTGDDIVDSFSFLALVHGRAAARATIAASTAELESLDALVERLGDAAASDDRALLADLNWEFHREINRLARSAKLLALIRAVTSGLPRSYGVELPGPARDAVREKAAIVAAMHERDAAKADRLTRAHLARLGTRVLAYFREKGLVEPEAR